MAYTTLFVRLFSYVTAVLLAIRKEGGPVRPLLLFVLRNLKKKSVLCKSGGNSIFFGGGGGGVNFLMIKKSQNKQQCRSINTISNLVHLHM